jgi:DNA topoisomerase-6 subunit B
MVHIASVWVPFTSESKEAVASYPEIQKELRLGLQAVGRKLGMYLRARNRVRHEADRRATFLRYLGEVATAVHNINGTNRESLYNDLLLVAKKQTSEADAKFDDRGKRVAEADEDFGGNVLIVDPNDITHAIKRNTKNEQAAATNNNDDDEGDDEGAEGAEE